MSMRDLIPWGRQSNVPASYRDEDFNPIVSLQRNVNRLFDDIFRDSFPSTALSRGLASWPTLEVNETDKEIRITAEVPGLEEKDVELFVDDGMLTLRGEKKSETEDRARGYSERYYGRFERRIALPSGVKDEEANATFRNGVLTITFPRSAHPDRGRKIPINAETRH